MATVDINVTAGKEHVKEAWVWQLAKQFNVKVNIKQANVDREFGWMQLEFEGPIEEIQRATAWLMTTGLHVEAQQRAVGAS